MGCLFSSGSGKPEELSPEPKKQFSWDKRPKVNVDDISFKDRENETLVKLPNSLKGSQFIIKNLKNCTVYLLDHMNTVTVDDCEDCKIFIGPIKTSIFVRDCKNMKLMAACQQFRTRDCSKMDCFLCCTSQPIIESTINVRFGCMQVYYPEFQSQMDEAGLSIYNNKWSSIHDFTPVPGEDNYTLLSTKDTNDLSSYIPLPPDTEEFSTVHGKISFEKNQSVIPLSYGIKCKGEEDSCLVIFFHQPTQKEICANFTKKMNDEHPSCRLLRSKEIGLKPAECRAVFGDDNRYEELIKIGEEMQCVVLPLENCNCAVCLEPFLERDPRILNCFHTFCFKCLEECGKNLLRGQIFCCPVCRRATFWPAEGAGGFQKNYYFDNTKRVSHFEKKAPQRRQSSTCTSVSTSASTSSTQTSRKALYESLCFCNNGYFETCYNIIQIFAADNRIVTLERLMDGQSAIVEYDFEGRNIGTLYTLREATCIALNGSTLAVGCERGYVKVLKHIDNNWKLTSTFSLTKMLTCRRDRCIEQVALNNDMLYVIPEALLEDEKSCIRISLEDDPDQTFVDFPKFDNTYVSLLIRDETVFACSTESFIMSTERTTKIEKRIQAGFHLRSMSPNCICFMNNNILMAESHYLHMYDENGDFLTSMDIGLEMDRIFYVKKSKILFATKGKRVYVYTC
ncbi:DgyrCDS9400 [Dimorphilus gyrociliatus]|uniref:Protein XRP2 n=1 Tax=Dimorphilus gyrociliatus TaxID=2664684 RepID=A0A7I8VYB9_9ANNE|nr:DgyrCDS9400 [Dimorphilus gyrociliatus]